MLCRRCTFFAARKILPLIQSRSAFFVSPLEDHLLKSRQARFSIPLINQEHLRFIASNNRKRDSFHCDGSEGCVPAESYWTSEPDVPVKLRLNRNGDNHPHSLLGNAGFPNLCRRLSSFTKDFYLEARRQIKSVAQPHTLYVSGWSLDKLDDEANLEPTLTIPVWFTEIATRNGDAPAMTVYREGTATTWTYEQYLEDVRTAAKGFIALGLEPFHSVAIVGFNSPEWLISDIGAIFAGGLSVGVYTTNTPEACRFVAKAARTNIVVAEDDAQIRKILKFKSELPNLKAIVQYTGEPDRRIENIYSWTEFMALSEKVTNEQLAQRQQAIAPNKCCSVIFTSGTTGVPKGAMLSHDNLIWTAKAAIRDGEIHGEQTFVSYLPLSHVAAHLADVYLPITSAGHVHFGQPNALKDKGSLVDTLKTAKPTLIVGVPRVWEKMEEQITMAMAKNVLLKMVFERAQRVGLQAFYNKQEGKAPPWEMMWARVIFKLVRSKLGLERCTHTCSGAAPLMRDTQEFFLSLDMPIYDIYGLSETSAPHSLSKPSQFKLGSAGLTLSGAKTKIRDPDENGVGEICMYGRHIFMGYLGMKERTGYAFDKEAYFRTGDMGSLDEEGFLFVTGRLKEVIVTAGGEKVPPLPIEDRVKEQLPIVSHCLLIGDQRRFISILLTLKSEVDLEKGQPLSRLTAATRDWIKEKSGATVTTVEDAMESEPLRDVIQAALDNVNESAAHRAQRINKFRILPVDLSIPGGELGPTLKVRRSIVTKKYEDLIDEMYEVE